jgi:CopG family nickel-responsive transcriptional regulator
MALVRFSIAIDDRLLESFDTHIEKHGYATRSEAIRDLIRRDLVELADDPSAGDDVVCGTLTLVYDHQVTELSQRLTMFQHDLGASVISTLHVHLDHDHCLEVVVMRGRRNQIGSASDALLALKGVVHGRLTLTGVPAAAPAPTHDHSHHTPTVHAHVRGEKTL